MIRGGKRGGDSSGGGQWRLSEETQPLFPAPIAQPSRPAMAKRSFRPPRSVRGRRGFGDFPPCHPRLRVHPPCQVFLSYLPLCRIAPRTAAPRIITHAPALLAAAADHRVASSAERVRPARAAVAHLVASWVAIAAARLVASWVEISLVPPHHLLAAPRSVVPSHHLRLSRKRKPSNSKA